MTSFFWDEPISNPANAGKLDEISRSIVNATRNTQNYEPQPLAGQGNSPSGPITIAVYGPWGSGKTSFLKCMQHHFENPTDSANAATAIWFEPWRYEREENLIVPLLTEMTSVIVESLPDTEDKAKQAAIKTGTKLMGRIAKATARTAAGFMSRQVGLKSEDIEEIGKDFLSYYEGESERYSYPVSENEAFKKDFQELVRLAGSGKLSGEQDRPVCIFIDDLDRCSSDQVRRLLESMKNFLWTDGVIYVLALDREQVTMALAEQHLELFKSMGESALLASKERAKNYMEKFFLYAYDLESGAEYYERNVVSVTRDSLFKELKDEVRQKNSLSNNIWSKLENIYNQTGLNLRRIKRVLRWLYYEIQIDQIEKDALASNFSEVIISENYAVLWLDQLSSSSLVSRCNIYRAISSIGSAIGISTTYLSSTWEDDLVADVKTVLNPPEGKDIEALMQNSFLIDIRSELERISDSRAGDLLYNLLLSEDRAEMHKLYVLCLEASKMFKEIRIA